MEGFSKQLLENHFTLCQAYVTNTNNLVDILARMLKDGRTGRPEYAKLKGRFGWEFNGMRLHEFYFDSLGAKQVKVSGIVYVKGGMDLLAVEKVEPLDKDTGAK